MDSSTWLEQYTHGVLLILPPPHIRETFNQLRSEHDPQSAGICEAHISVTTGLINPLTLEQHNTITSVLLSRPAISLRIGGIRNFEGTSVVYYDVEPKAEIIRMRDSLLATGLFHPSPHPHFVPHLTIAEFGYGKPEQTAALIAKLRENPLQFSFECTDLVHMRIDRGGRFQPVGRYRLGWP